MHLIHSLEASLPEPSLDQPDSSQPEKCELEINALLFISQFWDWFVMQYLGGNS